MEMEGRGKDGYWLPVSHNNRTVSSSLFQSVITDSISGVEIGPAAQDREFGVHVAVYTGD